MAFCEALAPFRALPGHMRSALACRYWGHSGSCELKIAGSESMTWPRRIHSRGDPYTAAVMLGTPTQCGQPVLKTSFPTALQCFVF